MSWKRLHRVLPGDCRTRRFYAPGAGQAAPAVSNYKAMVGTHIQNTGTLSVTGGSLGTPLLPADNGGMTLYPTVTSDTTATRWVSRQAGLPISSLSDGTSKTIVLAESRERGYASWIDGSMAWVVGYDPNETTDIVYGNGNWRVGTNSGAVVTAKGIGYPATLSPSAARYMPVANVRQWAAGRPVPLAWHSARPAIMVAVL